VPGKERYERVEPRHSWNSNNIATNVLLYHLQRHSDHHAHPTRRYQALRDEKGAPALPTGYAGMILLALAPPLWNRVMNPRVLAHYDGDMALANIQPSKRDGVLRRYPTATPRVADARPGDTRSGSLAVLTGACVVATCPGCGYAYDERVGDSREGFPAGTPFSAVPDEWSCPDCGVRDKIDFVLSTSTSP
jgi:alkane 1-monooxygenase